MLKELINRIIKEPDPSNGCEDDEIDGDGDGGIVGNLAKSEFSFLSSLQKESSRECSNPPPSAVNNQRAHFFISLRNTQTGRQD